MLFFGWLFYVVNLLLSTSSIIVKNNISSYDLVLISESSKKTYNKKCESQECIIENVKPWSYDVLVSSQGYVNVTTSVQLFPKKQATLDVLLKKEVTLIETNKTLYEPKTWTNAQENIKEMIKIKSQKFYKEIADKWVFYFEENESKLNLYFYDYFTTIKLADFNAEWVKKIDIIDVIWDNKIIAKVDDIYTFIDFKTNSSKSFTFKQEFKYVKSTDNNNFYIVVTPEWSFNYNVWENKLDYFYAFKDYVFDNDNEYIWVVYKDEKQKLDLYSLEQTGKNYIIKYNFITKQRDVLLQTDMNIDRILIKKDGIYFYDEKLNEYFLEK